MNQFYRGEILMKREGNMWNNQLLHGDSGRGGRPLISSLINCRRIYKLLNNIFTQEYV